MVRSGFHWRPSTSPAQASPMLIKPILEWKKMRLGFSSLPGRSSRSSFCEFTTAYQKCLLNHVDNAPYVSRSISSLRKSVLLSIIFFFLIATFLVLTIGAYFPYPRNFCRDESFNQHYRLLKQKSQHYQDRRILWHRHVPPRILLRSC